MIDDADDRDDLEAVRALSAEYRQRANALGAPVCRVIAEDNDAFYLFVAGDLAAAAAAAQRGVDIAHDARLTNIELAPRLRRIWIRAAQGVEFGHDEIRSIREAADARGDRASSWYARFIAAVCFGADGRVDEARDEMDVLVDDYGLELRMAGPWYGFERSSLEEACGNLDGAAAILDALASDPHAVGPRPRANIAMRRSSIERRRGQTETAEDLIHGALATYRRSGYRGYVAHALEALGEVAAETRSYVEACRLFGASERLRDETGYRYRELADQARHHVVRAEAHDALGDEEFEQHLAEGRAMSWTDAIDYATRARGERGRPTFGWASLTPTERKVADLAADGNTNPEIATQLLMGRETVKSHLSSIFRKLGIANRSQLTAEVVTRRTAPD
jgi:DNA-binding CsgD family transcriptional regulator